LKDDPGSEDGPPLDCWQLLILNPLFIQFSPAEKRGGVLANLTFQL
jgi:hypothetical protein